MGKLNANTREKIIHALAQNDVDNSDYMSSRDIYYLAVNGQIGYKDYSDKMLIEALEHMCDCDEETGFVEIKDAQLNALRSLLFNTPDPKYKMQIQAAINARIEALGGVAPIEAHSAVVSETKQLLFDAQAEMAIHSILSET